MVRTDALELQTEGNGDTLDITNGVARAVRDAGIDNGIVTVFATGSTCGVTTIEYEPGAVADLQRACEKIAPRGETYQHHLRWGDDNGHSHVRAALLGCSLTVPVVDGGLALGTWQQIVFIDFDTRSRRRNLVLQIMGE